MKNWKSRVWIVLCTMLFAGTIIYFSIKQNIVNIKKTPETYSSVIDLEIYSKNDDIQKDISLDGNSNQNSDVHNQHLLEDIFFYYVVVQNLGYEGVPNFFEQAETEGYLRRLKLFNNELREIFDFYRYSTQFVQYMNDFKEVVSGDTDGFVLSPVNQVINLEDGSTLIVTTLKTLMFGEESVGFLDELIDEGRSFNASDFLINSSDALFKVILGHAYSEHYKIGDKMTVNLYRNEIILEIVGFMKMDSSLVYETALNLDHTIIMPIVDLDYEPEDWDEEMFQIFYYAMINEGVVRTKAKEGVYDYDREYYEAYRESIYELSRQIEDIAARHNLYYSAGGTTLYPFLDDISFFYN